MDFSIDDILEMDQETFSKHWKDGSIQKSALRELRPMIEDADKKLEELNRK